MCLYIYAHTRMYIYMTRKTSTVKPGNQSLTCHLPVVFDQEIKSGLNRKEQ